jgi:hypothetical protein
LNRELARKVANAVLYEGYMLYPYRPSAIKNRQRWTFGILYPPAYPEVGAGTERSGMHSECLLTVKTDVRVEFEVRFLHLMTRQAERKVSDHYEPVASLVVDGKAIDSWDEGVERSVEGSVSLSPENPSHESFEFRFPASRAHELLQDSTGSVMGRISRIQHEVRGTVSVSSEKVRDGVLKLAIDVANESSLPAHHLNRDAALLQSLLSAHAVLSASGGQFVSLLDPPDDLRDAVTTCGNTGNFPVLVGDAGDRDMLLCSPILLYDYPQIAPESSGDFYDATEMDEMLTLRVMTLTDEEKDQMRFADDRVRRLLQRTEESAREQLMRTHGTIRGGLRPASES